MKIAYLVHDTTDSTVRRRVRMLHEGGADVRVIGFRRSSRAPHDILGAPVADLGRTYDARLVTRCVSIMRAFADRKWRRALADADVVLARNLEMLLLARFRARARPGQRIVYESLDIHRVLLSSGPAGAGLRWLERLLLRRSDLLLFSSPAFLHYYFEAWQHYRGPGLLLENKVSAFPSESTVAASLPIAPASAPPWRLGWFGNIRCAKSLRILTDVANKLDGLLEVVIRGRVSHVEFDDFDRSVAEAPYLSYEGPYREEDLPTIYAAVHFVWAIDFFEEGLNSAWLLPCRLYEGTLHNAVPIAQREVETGRWMEARGVGVCLDDSERDSVALFRHLTQAQYRALISGARAIPREALRITPAECRALVDAIGGR